MEKCHAMKAGSTAMTQRPRDRVPSGSLLALANPGRPDRANTPTNFWWSLFWQYWYDLHALDSHWIDSQQGILCWGFKGVQQEIPSEEASTLQIGSVTFPPEQCTSPQLHSCHRLSIDGIKMGIKTVPHPTYSLYLAPCDFRLFPKLRGCRYETIEEMKEAVTKVIDTLTQEDFHGGVGLPGVVGTVQMHCSRRRLLRRGLEFHECTINESSSSCRLGSISIK